MTRNAVLGKSHRLGLVRNTSAGVSTSRPRQESPAPGRPPTAEPSMRPGPKPVISTASQPPHEQPRVVTLPVDEAAPPRGGLTIMELREGMAAGRSVIQPAPSSAIAVPMRSLVCPTAPTTRRSPTYPLPNASDCAPKPKVKCAGPMTGAMQPALIRRGLSCYDDELRSSAGGRSHVRSRDPHQA